MNKYIKNTLLFSGSLALINCESRESSQNVNKEDNITPSSLAMPLKDAPNIIYIVIDDMGFSDLGAYGSEISTPNIDKLAENGLRYNNFHVNPMSSPTRASLLTGRNSHSVGMSRLANYSLDVPHAMGEVTEKAAFTPKILKKAGYSTLAVGKWHLAPAWELSASGPFNNWALAKGFEQFYGFMDGETDQYYPELVEGNAYLEIEYEDDYHLTEDITEKAISYIQSVKSVDEDKPFMLYYSTGAQHSPHQVPKEYADRYEGVYDIGWDEIRKQRFESQKELGVIPSDASLAPLNENVLTWDSLDEDVKKLFVEYQKNYAGFLEHTDENIGHLILALEEMGELDNTIIFLISDNGPSPSGKAAGTLNSVNIKNGLTSSLEEDIKYIDEVGQSSPNYPTGWSQVSATPFRYYKESADYLGGIRVPLIVYYPDGIDENNKGKIRNQFSYVTDIAMTVFDVLGLDMPNEVDGVSQIEMQGYSLVNTFNDSSADTGREIQFFETYGNRGLYYNNYFLSSVHKKGDDFENDTFKLYDLSKDYSQLTDISSENEKQLKLMIKKLDEELEKNFAYPLDDRGHVDLLMAQVKKDIAEFGNSITLYPNTSLINPNISVYPTAFNRSHTITAYIDRKNISEEGVLIAFGNRFGGYTFYIMDNMLHYEYNFDRKPATLMSEIVVPIGEIKLSIVYERENAQSGTATLFVNDKEAGELYIDNVYPLVPSSTDGMSIGRDLQDAVSSNYRNKGHFEYNGELEKVIIDSKDDFAFPKKK